MAVGPFIESVSDGRRSFALAGIQLIGSQQVYSSGGLTISPALSMAIGFGLKNYDGSPLTGASLALGLAIGTVRSGFLVFDPTVLVSGQGGGVGFGISVSGIVPFGGGS